MTEINRAMKTKRLLVSVVAIVALAGFGAVWADTGAEQTESREVVPAITARQIEADWLRQDMVRGIVSATPDHQNVTPEEDAIGGCDTVMNGLWGFCTAVEENPWWQIQLERSWPLDHLLIYNRCDRWSERASRLIVLLSDDGKTWKEVYRHDGTTFLGYTDNKPLAVPLDGARAQYVRIQLPGKTCLHLDEVGIYSTVSHRNVALPPNNAVPFPATQSSTGRWSRRTLPRTTKVKDCATATEIIIRRGLLLAESLRHLDAPIEAEAEALEQLARRIEQLPSGAPEQLRRELYFKARWAVRRMSLANPLLDFDDLLFVKRVPARALLPGKPGKPQITFTHPLHQFYGWWSRPGGGLYLLKGFKSESPKLHCLSEGLPPGNIIRPDISYDGTKVLFAYCKHIVGVSEVEDKVDKANIPEEVFYHLYEMKLDGTGLRRLTRGKYDNFDGRYVPGGQIVFLSTQRGRHIQCSKAATMASMDGARPDSYMRCGMGLSKPSANYVLHMMDADGQNVRPVSSFETSEWTPSVDHEGRILYARWDYIDRDAMPYIGLWSTTPDGGNVRALFGNYTQKPHCTLEPRAIPNSRKIVFTASAHHANTAGSLVLLDVNKGDDGQAAMTRLTPEVPFPEIEAWPETYFANPFPLSEEHYLVTWSDQPLKRAGQPSGAAAMGVYLFDAFGNLNLIYRDPTISCMYPLPIRPRPVPPRIGSVVDWDGPQEGRMLLTNVYQGLEGVTRGSIRRLRLVGVPPKTHPDANYPSLGLTHQDPGKFVMGAVPVEEDGSAYFRVPSGVLFFMQVLDQEGMAVQTMRSGVYVQPGQTFSCIGCHEPRNTAPPSAYPMAARREPSKITPGPGGSWPLDFQVLVQPVMEKHCTECHQPGTEGAEFDLTTSKSYDALVNYGAWNLKTHVRTRHRQGYSVTGGCAARMSPLVQLLEQGHYDVKLGGEEWDRLITWMDTYAQRLGSFSQDQEQQLRQLRQEWASMLGQ